LLSNPIPRLVKINHLMKKLALIVFACCMYIISHAQNTNQSKDPNSGNFEVLRNSEKGMMHINVNYSVALANPSTLRLYMNTPIAMIFAIKITDAHGNAVINWLAEQADRTCDKSFDITNLKAGKYNLNIYNPDNKKIVRAVSFTKGQATATNNTTISK